MIPGVAALIGGALDLIETKIIADRAYKWFINSDFSIDDEITTDEDIITVEVTEDDFID